MDSTEHSVTRCFGWFAWIHSNRGSSCLLTLNMQLFGQHNTAFSTLSSESFHCVTTRATLSSSSIANVPGAAWTHCLHPTHKPSSTNNATGNVGFAFRERGAPVNGSLRPDASVKRASSPNRARAPSYVARRFASRSTCHARFTSEAAEAASRSSFVEPSSRKRPSSRRVSNASPSRLRDTKSFPPRTCDVIVSSSSSSNAAKTSTPESIKSAAEGRDSRVASDAKRARRTATSGWHFFMISRYASLISSVVADDDTPRSA
mmetsp:Transcript_9675/g.41066  ORF Transcript_9675/g.41066 Transcript_9675/m.41066 type:complete len:261 (-) Transcript_9675:291-1073(-)